MFSMPTTDSLVLDIYGSCTDARRWNRVCEQLSREMNIRSVSLQSLVLSGDRLQCLWNVSNSDVMDKLYRRHITDSGNPRLEAKRILALRGELVCDDNLFTAHEGDLRKRFQQQLSHLGLGKFIGSLIQQGEGRYLGLALHRSHDDPRDFSPHQQQRLAALLPHFQQAFLLSHQLYSSHRVVEALRRHLNHWHCGLLLCNPYGEVEWHNHIAEQLLGPVHGTWRLHTRATLHPLYRAVIQQSLGDDRAVDYLELMHASNRLHLAIHRLPPSDIGVPPSVLVAVTAPEILRALPYQALMTLFHLTETEARLSCALVQGITVDQYAQQRGVSVGTARYQLKQVLAKTGADRQSTLIRKILCSAAASFSAD